MGRGGDDIRVTVVPNDKKDRLVLHSQVSRVKSTDETGNLRSFAIGGMLTAVVTSYLPTMLFNNVIGPAGPDVFSCVGFRPIFNFSQRSDLPLRLSSPQALNRLKIFSIRLNGALLKIQPHSATKLCWAQSSDWN